MWEKEAERWLSILTNLGRAPNTILAYRRALDDYLDFCTQQQKRPLHMDREQISLFVRSFGSWESGRFRRVAAAARPLRALGIAFPGAMAGPGYLAPAGQGRVWLPAHIRRQGNHMDGIHITRWGGSGPRVVMVHGGAQGSKAAGERNFAAQKPLADEGWQLVVPDRPGHGKSPSPGRGDDSEADAVWVADLLGDGAHLVGHSFGGLVALAAAARRPDVVLSLTLIEPALHKLATRDPAVRKFLLRLAASTLLSFSPLTRARRVMRTLHIPVADFGRDDGELRAMGVALRRMKLPAKAAIERNLAAVKAAGIPLLIVSGGSNQAFVAAGEAGAAMGDGKHVIAPSEHHFPQWNGTSFNILLTEFWRDGVTKRATR